VTTIFSRIIAGELPGRFVWRDPQVVAFLTIEPMAPGHTLVVPRAEVDHWIDLPPELHQRLWEVAQAVGRAIDTAFAPRRVGVVIAGDEVPHTHVHVVGFQSVGQLSFAGVDRSPDPAALDAAAEAIRAALRAAGHPEADA
jgi:histidine triad (HIT) family protein